MHNQVLSGSDGQNKHEQFSPKKWNKGKLERRLIVLPNLPTHNSQSKTYGNPFLQPGSPVLQVQMRSNQDHRFFCKEKQHSLRASICAHLHSEVLVWYVSCTPHAPDNFTTLRSKCLDDGVLQQYRVGASQHFTQSKHLLFWYTNLYFILRQLYYILTTNEKGYNMQHFLLSLCDSLFISRSRNVTCTPPVRKAQTTKYLRISIKVSIVDGFYQLLCYLNNFLFTHCEQGRKSNLTTHKT